MTSPHTVALVVAAGTGSRCGGEVPKQFLPIGGKALLAHALDHLRHPALGGTFIAVGESQGELLADALGDRHDVTSLIGGATRQESVRRGLEAIAAGGGADRVLIHDAARAFLPVGVIDRLLGALDESQGAVPVLPLVDSLARLEGDALAEAVGRAGLARVQTPQAFRFPDILEAHRSWASDVLATDDAQVARAAGLRVVAVTGDEVLEKITLPGDFARAERRLAERMISRTGLGFDVHRLEAGEELWLGGVLIPHDRGLSGHSDADVALHALTDALLGAIGAGDIGTHFPPSDPQWRGAPSARFLAHAAELIAAGGGIIDHVDLTLICEFPRIGPYREQMRGRIAELLRLPARRVSIKATTTERLGFAGRGEGIAAQAAATVRTPEPL